MCSCGPDYFCCMRVTWDAYFKNSACLADAHVKNSLRFKEEEKGLLFLKKYYV